MKKKQNQKYESSSSEDEDYRLGYKQAIKKNQ